MYSTLKSLMALSAVLICLGLGSQASAQVDYTATIVNHTLISGSDGSTDAVVRMTVAVDNIGSTNASSASKTLLTAKNTSKVITTFAIDAGDQKTVNKLLVIPAADIYCDCDEDNHMRCTAELTATADVLGQISESNEGNNTDAYTISIASGLFCD